MNRNEFKELQNEVAQLVYSYERFLKKGNILDIEYNYYFHEYLEKGYKLEQENILLQSIIASVSDEVDMNKIEKMIVDFKNKFNQTILGLKQKEQKCKIVFEHTKNLSSLALEEFEREYQNYIEHHHPAILIHTTQNDMFIYNQLKNLYFENNCNAFYEMLEMCKKGLSNVSIEEKQYIEAAKYYYDIQFQIRSDMEARKNKYPYNKESVFEDELSIAGETADFKVRMNRLLGMNKSLHKDLIKVYKDDINL